MQRTFVASDGVETDPVLDQSAVPNVWDRDRQDARRWRGDRSGLGRLWHRHDHQIGVDHRAGGRLRGVWVAAGQTGLTVNAPGATVVLRGLSINGIAPGSVNGIHFLQGVRLRIEGCVVSNLSSSGIIQDAPGSEMVVLDTIVRDNFGSGARIQTDATAVFDNFRAVHNAGDGIYVVAAASDAFATARRSVLSHNGGSGAFAVLPKSDGFHRL